MGKSLGCVDGENRGDSTVKLQAMFLSFFRVATDPRVIIRNTFSAILHTPSRDRSLIASAPSLSLYFSHASFVSKVPFGVPVINFMFSSHAERRCREFH